jgi:hypothetical protein
MAALWIPPGTSSELQQVIQKIQTGDPDVSWVVITVGGVQAEVKITGLGGSPMGTTSEVLLETLSEELDETKEQFAFARIAPIADAPAKLILICWCGEGIAPARRTLFTSHVSEVDRLFAGYHVRIMARGEADIEPKQIIARVRTAAGAKYGEGVPNSISVQPVPPQKAVPSTTPAASMSISSAQSVNASSTASSHEVTKKPPLVETSKVSGATNLGPAGFVLPTSTSSTVEENWLTRALSSPPSARKEFSTHSHTSIPTPSSFTRTGSISKSTPSPAIKPEDTEKEGDAKTARDEEMQAMIAARIAREQNEPLAPLSHKTASQEKVTFGGNVSELAQKFSSLSSTSSAEKISETSLSRVNTLAKSLNSSTPNVAHGKQVDPAPPPQVSAAPSSFGITANSAVSNVPLPTQSVESPTTPKVGVDHSIHNLYVAEYPWQAQDESEVTLAVGCAVYKVSEMDGWCVVELFAPPHTRGMVPSNHLQAIPDLGHLEIALANFDYAPTDDQEIQLVTGCLIVDIQREDPDWWKGTLSHNHLTLV